ncbi:MAG: heavy metal-responsive transcriptional regulator [Vicinamibacteria bacterium]
MPFTSGSLARQAGVSSDTLRHYERTGVLAKPGRSANNYREYPDSALARVHLIRRALAFGFSLAELTVILRERDKGGAPCRKVRAIAEAKLAATEDRLIELTRLRDDLQSLLEDWENRLSGVAPGQPARLLDSLPALTHINLNKDNPHDHEPVDPPPSRRTRGLSGHWSHESAEKRTPARRQQKR